MGHARPCPPPPLVLAPARGCPPSTLRVCARVGAACGGRPDGRRRRSVGPHPAPRGSGGGYAAAAPSANGAGAPGRAHPNPSPAPRRRTCARRRRGLGASPPPRTRGRAANGGSVGARRRSGRRRRAPRQRVGCGAFFRRNGRKSAWRQEGGGVEAPRGRPAGPPSTWVVCVAETAQGRFYGAPVVAALWCG